MLILNNVNKFITVKAFGFASMLLCLVPGIQAQSHDRSLCAYLNSSTAILIGRFENPIRSDEKRANPREETITVAQAIKGIRPGVNQLSALNHSYSAEWEKGQEYLIFLWEGKKPNKFTLASAFPVVFIDNVRKKHVNGSRFLISFGDFFTAEKGFLETVKASVFAKKSRYSAKITNDGVFAIVLGPTSSADVLVEGPKSSEAGAVGSLPPEVSYLSDKTLIKYSLRPEQFPCTYQQFHF